jgi:hypothetical protein
MKFVKHHLDSISGIEIYPLISLCIFFIFFIGLLVYVVKMNKNYVETMESLPLEKETE